MGDWKNHLSTLFPEVRLKTYLEMRGADGGPWRRLVRAAGALGRPALRPDSRSTPPRSSSADWTAEERQALRDAVPKTALATQFRDRTVLDIAREVVELARDGLRRRAIAGNGSPDEAAYLGPLEETLALGQHAGGKPDLAIRDALGPLGRAALRGAGSTEANDQRR